MLWFKKPSDLQVVRLVLGGHREAFGTLVERYVRAVQAVAYAGTGNHADADDVTQDAFLKALQRLDTLREPAKFGPWLITITKRCCSQVHRTARREAAQLADIRRKPAVHTPDVEQQELRDMLRTQLEELDEIHREVLTLYYFAGKSAPEIAHLLAVSKATVRKRLQRARNALSDRMLKELTAAGETEGDERERVARIMGVALAAPVAWEVAGHSAGALTAAGVLQRLGGWFTMGKITLLIAMGLAATVGLWRGQGDGERTAAEEPKTAPLVIASNIGASAEDMQFENASDALKKALDLIISQHEASESEPEPIEVEVETPPVRKPRLTWERPTKGTGTIHGIVVYPDGSKVAGARVDLGRNLLGTHQEGAPPKNVWKTTTADNWGRFTFTNLSVSDYRLMAYGPDGILLRSVYGASKESHNTMDGPNILELQNGGPIAGTVVDEHREAVAAAAVYPKWGRDNWTKSMAVVTDEEGRFRIDSLFSRRRWDLLVVGDNIGAAVVDDVPVGTESLQITLSPGASVSGKVINEATGEAVTDVVVEISLGVHAIRSATDSQGEFRMAGIPTGEWPIALDDASLVVPLDLPQLEVHAGETITDLLIAARPGGKITGEVCDAQTGAPLENVQVVARKSGSGDCFFSEPADSEGAFAVSGLQDGAYVLQLATPGCSLAPGAGGEVIVGAGEVVPAGTLKVVAASTGPHITGSVFDEEGRPVAGAAVFCESEGITHAFAFSDSSGHFDLEIGTPIQDVYIGARKADRLASERIGPADVTASGMDDLRIEVSPAAVIEGELVDANGNFFLTSPLKAIVTAVPVFPVEGASPHTLTGLEGWFRLSGLTAGAYDVYAEAQKPEEAPFLTRMCVGQVRVDPGEELTGFRAVYGEEVQGLTISGRVTTAEGEPVRYAYIRAEGNGYSWCRSQTDGTYVLTGLDEGEYRVSVESANLSGECHDAVPAGSVDIDFVLAGLGSVEGQVLSAVTRQPVEDFVVASLSGGYGTSCNVHDTEGRFRLEHVQTGDVRLVVRSEGYAPSTVAVEDVPENDTVSGVLVYLDTGGEIRGCVTLGGQPIPGSRVIAYVSGQVYGYAAAQDTTDEDGVFTLSGLTPGETNVQVMLPAEVGRRRGLSRDVVVAKGQVTPLNVDFPPADAELSGVIRFDGAAPASAQVGVQVTAASGEPPEWLQVDAEPDGTYWLDNVPVGSAELMVTAQSVDASNRSGRAVVETRSRYITRRDFNFTRGQVLSGQIVGLRADEQALVIAREGEYPIAESTADSLLAFQGNASGKAAVDSTGRYELDGLEPGTFTVGVFAYQPDSPGGRRQILADMRFTSGVVIIGPDGPNKLDLVLP